MDELACISTFKAPSSLYAEKLLTGQPALRRLLTVHGAHRPFVAKHVCTPLWPIPGKYKTDAHTITGSCFRFKTQGDICMTGKGLFSAAVRLRAARESRRPVYRFNCPSRPPTGCMQCRNSLMVMLESLRCSRLSKASLAKASASC